MELNKFIYQRMGKVLLCSSQILIVSASPAPALHPTPFSDTKPRLQWWMNNWRSLCHLTYTLNWFFSWGVASRAFPVSFGNFRFRNPIQCLTRNWIVLNYKNYTHLQERAWRRRWSCTSKSSSAVREIVERTNLVIHNCGLKITLRARKAPRIR